MKYERRVKSTFFLFRAIPFSKILSSMFSSIQIFCSVVSYSLRPHELQHARLPYSSPTVEACSNSCPSSRWCYPTISSCHPLLLLPSVFPSIRVFSISSITSGGQSTVASALASVLPMNIQDWFLLGLTVLILSKGLKSLLQHHSSKASILQHLAFFYGSTLTSRHAAAAAKSHQSCPTLYNPTDGSPPGSAIPGILQARILEWVGISFSHAWKWKVKVKLLSRDCWKNIALTRRTFVAKVKQYLLLFKTLSRLVIPFLPRS